MSVSFLGMEISLYGLAFFLGIAVAAALAVSLFNKNGISIHTLALSALYTIVSAMLGAKLLYIAVTWSAIVEWARFMILSGNSYFEVFLELMQGGFVFYGGLIGGILGLFIYCRQFKMPLLKIFDIYAVVLPLGHALGRVGCFFGGCCYGMPYDGVLSYKYFVTPENGGAAGLYGKSLFPVQLFESAFLIAIFLLLYVLYRKFSHSEGLFTFLYAVLYSISRFILEFFRYDSIRGAYLGLSTSQWISLILVIGAGVFLYFNLRRKYNLPLE